jgi:DNA-binding response OmpR family regulator
MKPIGLALILEDDLTVSEMIKEVVVEESDLWPMVFKTCREAEAFMRSEERLPELVILDYALVGENFECLHRLREERKKRQSAPLPLIMANKEVLVVLADKWLHVLEKPITYARLRAILRDKNSTPRPKKGKERRGGREKGSSSVKRG